LAAIDEKDLPTTQSPASAHTRLSRPDGDARRTQCSQAPAGKGPDAARNLDSSEAARLEDQAPYLVFSAADRLHRRSEYLRIQRDGLRFQAPHFITYAATAPQSSIVRIGITVSRRIGGAVVRNRVKRRVRETFRLALRPLLPPGTDLVVIARAGAGQLDSHSLSDELRAAVMSLRHRMEHST
jgi:ribonuclease P protein component